MNRKDGGLESATFAAAVTAAQARAANAAGVRPAMVCIRVGKALLLLAASQQCVGQQLSIRFRKKKCVD